MALNGPAWFLSTIAFCFFAFPFLSGAIKRFVKKQTVVFLIMVVFVEFLISVVCFVFCESFKGDNYTYFTYVFPPYRLLDFLSGMLMGRLYSATEESFCKSNKPFFRSMATFFELLVLGYAFFCVIETLHMRRGFIGKVFFNGTTAYLVPALLMVWVFARNAGIVTALVCRIHALVCLGDISDNAYLLHYVVTCYTLNVLGFFDITPSFGGWLVLVIIQFLLTIVLCNVYSVLKNYAVSIVRRNE